MTDKTDTDVNTMLIEKMLDRAWRYGSTGEEFDFEHATKMIKGNVQDYWQKHFIEQACEAVRSQIVQLTFADDIEEWNLALEAAEQAIRDKFSLLD